MKKNPIKHPKTDIMTRRMQVLCEHLMEELPYKDDPAMALASSINRLVFINKVGLKIVK